MSIKHVVVSSRKNRNEGGVNELFQLRDRFLELAGRISEKYSVPSKIRVVNVLLRNVDGGGGVIERA